MSDQTYAVCNAQKIRKAIAPRIRNPEIATAGKLFASFNFMTPLLK
jgi:hypothetical protein